MPPDLSEAERPLAVFPPESSRETTCDNPPPRLAAECITSSIGTGVPREEHHPLPRPAAESADSNTGKGGGGQVHQPQGCGGGSKVGEGASGFTKQGGETQVTSSNVPLYRLSPALRATFTSVGATDKPYPFREILLMLKHYLYSKRHLFDPDDILFVNCGDDELGRTLGVSRFHYDDVKLLMAKQIRREQTRPVQNTLTQQPPDTTGVDIARAHRAVLDSDTQRAVDVCDERTSNCSAINVIKGKNETNGRTQLPGLNTCIVSSTTTAESSSRLVSESTSAAVSPVAGSSRQSSENVFGGRRRHRTRSIASYSICIPDIPDSNSDVESIYSYQGYETAFCRNTEFEESEDEAGDESELFEEYEIADDDDDVQEQDHSDDDDSVIEDVEVALIAIHTLCQDDSDFWADDSDTEDQSTDDDPELVAERWDCLSCGLRNKPFVRYCGKCWQIRKNWLPDRPKKRRRKRKPRPRKRSRLRSDSVKSEDANFLQSKETDEKQSTTSPSFISDSSQEVQDFGVLTKTLSTASTISVSASPVRSLSLDIHSSQDSGVCLSQDSFLDFSPESIMEDNKNIDKQTDTEVEETSQSGSAEEQPNTSEILNTTSASVLKAKESKEDSQSRKRKSLPAEEEEGKSSKRAKLESSSEEESEEGDVEEQAKSFYQFLQSSSGKEWLKSPDSKPFLSSAPVKEVLMEAIVANMGSGSSTDVHEPPSGLSIMCSVCFLRPKNASIIHGRLSHQATCYQCARRLLNSGSRCPICKRKIHMVCKNIIA